MATSNNQNTSFIELINSFRRSSNNENKINEEMLTELKDINKNIKKLNTNRIYNSLVSSTPNINEIIKKSVEGKDKEPKPKLGTFKDFIEGASERLTDYKNFFLNRENTDSKEEKRIELENKIDKINNEPTSESKDDTNKLSIDLQKKSIEILDDILGELTLSRKIAEGSLKRDNKGETAGRYRDTRTGQLIGSGIERASENSIEKIKKIKTETEEKAKPLLLQELKSERKDIKQVTKEFNEGKMSESKYNESVANIKQKYKESKAKIKQDSNLEASRLIKQSRTGLLSSDSVVAATSNSSSTSQQSVLSNNKIAEDISSMRKAMLGDGIAVKLMNPEEIKIEGGGGGGVGNLMPNIELPDRIKPGAPKGGSLGSRVLKFMTGTGGKALGAAAALGLGAYTAYSGYTEAEEKKQQEVQAIDEKVKSGEITSEKAEELKKGVLAKTTEVKGGAIGKGTGIVAGSIGGGIAGAKVGATIGTFLGGPLGTAIGGTVGGLAGGAIGAISGSSVGQNIGGAIGKGVASVKGFLGIKDSKEIAKTSENIEKESTDIQFSEMEFAKNDPENYKKFVEYRDQKTQELYKKELDAYKLTEKSPPQIVKTIRDIAQTKAKVEAIKKFKKEIEAAGATSIKTEQKSTKAIGMLSDGTPIRGESGTDVVAAQKTTREMVGSSTLETKSPATSLITSSNQPVIRPGGGKGQLDAIDPNQPVIRPGGGKGQLDAIDPNQPIIRPGGGRGQLDAIDPNQPIIRPGGGRGQLDTIEPGQQIIKSAPLTAMSQENQELKREQSAPIVAPPIISNSVQSTNTQTLAPIKAQPRSATSSSLEKYIERTAVYQ